MRITNKLSIVTTTLALSMFSLSPAHAEYQPTGIDAAAAQTIQETIVSPDVTLFYESPVISSTAAQTPEPDTPQISSAAVPPQELSLPVVAQTASPPPAPAKAISGKGATIAAAALAQLGVAQDCTRLVSNALAAAGINYHGWPAGYLSLGTVVSASEAQAGDLIYYQNGGTGLAHIAVYIGGGQAVHGGWNGGTTAIASANVGSGGTFIRV